MSGGQNGPRKFSEKIAIMERKLNEDEDAFSRVMREVREITSTNPPAESGLHPGHWNGPGSGGSLPNMHAASEEAASSSNYWPQASPPGRGRSPGSHYHPYRVQRSSQERVPPLHGGHAMPPYHHGHPAHVGMQHLQQVQHQQQQHATTSGHNPPLMQQHSIQGLSPPSDWGTVNRAHSAPSIHMLPGNMPNHSAPMSPTMSPYTPMTPYADSAQQSPVYGGSPVQQYNGGGGSTGGSPVNLLQRPDNSPQDAAGSLPNIHNIPPQLQQVPTTSCYHAQVGQRHSTGGTHVGPSRLSAAAAYTPESQSAPTSPALLGDNNLAPQWPNPHVRHFSNSPEALDIPNIVLTEADGLNVGMNDCFDPMPLDQQLDMNPVYNNMQDLTLDNNGAGPPPYSNGGDPGPSHHYQMQQQHHHQQQMQHHQHQQQQHQQQYGMGPGPPHTPIGPIPSMPQMVPTSIHCNGSFVFDAPTIYR